jgi:hypothetical protein
MGRDAYRWTAPRPDAAARGPQRGVSTKRPKKPAVLAANCVQQRSLYPVFPARAGFPLDLALLRHATLPCSPDVLLLRSERGNAFAEALPAAATGGARTVAVNTGVTVRRCAPGTYARITVLPQTVPENAGDDARVGGGAAKRTRVDIVKI